MKILQFFELSKINEIIQYSLPAVVTATICYLFFLNYIKSEEKRLKYLINLKKPNENIALKLQAYERMILFFERINPSNLLIRIQSINNDKTAYSISLITSIEKEFEHNITQQIYVSDEAWSVIVSSKNAVINAIKKFADNTSINSAEEFRIALLEDTLKNKPASLEAVQFLKKEAKSIL